MLASSSSNVLTELLGQRTEVLVPNAAGRHHPQLRGMGHHRVLWGLRQDGTYFPVEVSLGYFHLDEELYVVAHVLDITAKKAAELEMVAQHQRVARLNAALEQKVADRTHALLNTLEQLEQRRRGLAQALAAAGALVRAVFPGPQRGHRARLGPGALHHCQVPGAHAWQPCPAQRVKRGHRRHPNHSL